MSERARPRFGKGALCALATLVMLVYAQCTMRSGLDPARRCDPETYRIKRTNIDALSKSIIPSDGAIWFKHPDPKKGMVWFTSAHDGAGTRDQGTLTRMRTERALEFKKRAARIRNSAVRHAALYRRKLPKTLLPPDDIDTAYYPMYDRFWSKWSDFFKKHGPMRSITEKDKRLICESLLVAYHDLFPMFIFEIEESSEPMPRSRGSDNTYAWIDEHGTIRDSLMIIIVPTFFIDHPEVNRAFMAFMIGHEIGHGLGTRNDCHLDGDLMDEVVCEGDADDWAARVALRELHPDPDEYELVANAAADAMVAYSSAICLHPDCGTIDTGCDLAGAACGHPPAACRAEVIRAAITLDPIPACRTTWATSPVSGCADGPCCGSGACTDAP